MGFFSFKKIKQQEASIVLDIGSASVGGSLVVVRKEEPPLMLYTKRLPIPIQQKIDEKMYTMSLYRVIENVLADIVKNGIPRLESSEIKYAFCVYASPWFGSEAHTIHIQKDEPIQLTERYLFNLLKNERAAFIKKLKQREGEEVVLIEQNIIQTLLNGYPTEAPQNKRAREVAISTFLSIVPKRLHEKVQTMVYAHVHPQEVVHHSFSLTSYRTVTDLFPADSNSCIIDVSGEITDVSIVENDVITETHTFPIGRNALVRAISKGDESEYNVALTLLQSYAHGELRESEEKDIEKKIGVVLEKWFNAVSGTFSSEKTVFMTADMSALPLFVKMLEKKEKRRHISAKQIEVAW